MNGSEFEPDFSAQTDRVIEPDMFAEMSIVRRIKNSTSPAEVMTALYAKLHFIPGPEVPNLLKSFEQHHKNYKAAATEEDSSDSGHQGSDLWRAVQAFDEALDSHYGREYYETVIVPTQKFVKFLIHEETAVYYNSDSAVTELFPEKRVS